MTYRQLNLLDKHKYANKGVLLLVRIRYFKFDSNLTDEALTAFQFPPMPFLFFHIELDFIY